MHFGRMGCRHANMIASEQEESRDPEPLPPPIPFSSLLMFLCDLFLNLPLSLGPLPFPAYLRAQPSAPQIPITLYIEISGSENVRISLCVVATFPQQGHVIFHACSTMVGA